MARKNKFFEWRIQSPSGTLSGEQKAELVEKMEQIAKLIIKEGAKFEFEFDAGAVIAHIEPIATAEMKAAALSRAQKATSGLVGLFATGLMLLKGFGKQQRMAARKTILESFEKDFLDEQLAAACSDMSRRFREIVSGAMASMDGWHGKSAIK